MVGVACRVSTAYELDGEFWALCSRAPLFRRVSDIWSAEPLTNRGRTRSAQISSTPLISVGRHLYGFRKSTWERLSSSPSRIISLLASSSRSGLAVSSRRELLRISGKAWKVVVAAPKKRKATDDLPLSVFGSAKNAYLILDSGALLHVGSSRRKPVVLPSGTSSFSRGRQVAPRRPVRS